ncbi:MAG TPA: bifunctional GNAT family N-acetyltransferase/carbon-nitrogen hydrolase family protein [Saprospiraceae bacterium]|nr:bifunctional GNAT family N-acetyltransferase/carbon-nitrogen hydrolase family protein [Saprospiraceae bacterium]
MVKNIKIENLTIEQFEQLLSVMKASYPDWQGGYWELATIQKLLKLFPEGQFVILCDDKIAGCALSIIIDGDVLDDIHSYKEVTGDYTFSTHTDSGNTLYGIEVFINPEFRGLRLGRRLYDTRKALCERLNLENILFGGRMPNYHNYKDDLTPKQYVEKVKDKEIHDPVLNFQLSNDFHLKKLIKNYLPEDFQSNTYGALLEWINVLYEPHQKKISNKTKYIRLGLIQWKMRLFDSLEELFQQAEYFVDAISSYKADFAMFPEYFNGPLMAGLNDKNSAEAMRGLANYTDAIKQRFRELAVSYNVNIVAGSMPSYVDGVLRNTGFLCHRNGKIDQYEKIHITPDEIKYWGLQGGDTIKVFETDAGKVGILICYDVEFPELSRLLADQGMQILFVPFLTDTQNAYMRVRKCAEARAIENECYVAITGNVGTLPQVENLDIQYSQSAVFTPSDFAFPSNGIKSEATPNTEMILIADVDLRLLDELHEYGSVRNLKDRRRDLYSLTKVVTD